MAQQNPNQSKTSSTELSADFDVIVNEINDFIAILEERGQQYEDEATFEQVEFRSASRQLQAPPGDHDDPHVVLSTSTESEDSTPFASPRNTVIHVEVDPTPDRPEEPLYEEFKDVKENDYEAINVLQQKVRAVATATADLVPEARKPELKPKPKYLKMGEPNQPTKRVKALHNFKGSNNDEVSVKVILGQEGQGHL